MGGYPHWILAPVYMSCVYGGISALDIGPRIHVVCIWGDIRIGYCPPYTRRVYTGDHSYCILVPIYTACVYGGPSALDIGPHIHVVCIRGTICIGYWPPYTPYKCRIYTADILLYIVPCIHMTYIHMESLERWCTHYLQSR